jgi:hypothetical protein
MLTASLKGRFISRSLQLANAQSFIADGQNSELWAA